MIKGRREEGGLFKDVLYPVYRLSPHRRLRQSRVWRCRPHPQRRTFDGSVIGYQFLLLSQLAHATLASERRTHTVYLLLGEQ